MRANILNGGPKTWTVELVMAPKKLFFRQRVFQLIATMAQEVYLYTTLNWINQSSRIVHTII